jgi:hypothetical protein
MVKACMLAAGVAAATAQSVVTLKSPTNSAVAFGGAVINSYCASDVLPVFNAVTEPRQSSSLR